MLLARGPLVLFTDREDTDPEFVYVGDVVPFLCQLRDGHGAVIDLTGCTMTLSVTSPTGTLLVTNLASDTLYATNQVLFLIPAAATAGVGVCQVTVRRTNGTTDIQTAAKRLIVRAR